MAHGGRWHYSTPRRVADMVDVGYDTSEGAVLTDGSGSVCIGCCGGADECEYCTTTPLTLEVTPSGIADCSCYSCSVDLCGVSTDKAGYQLGQYGAGPAFSPAALLNGNTYTLTQTDFNACLWISDTIAPGGSSYYVIYDEGACSNPPGPNSCAYRITGVKLGLERRSDCVRV